MLAAASTPTTRGLALLLGWRRVVLALGVSALLGLIISVAFPTTRAVVVMGREMLVGLAALLAFGIFEQWPARMPAWLARWALQVLAVAFAIPVTVLAIYLVNTPAGEPSFWHSEARLSGFMMMTMIGLLVGPWVAVAALLRKIEYAMRSQAMAFNLERSELERKALDSRLRLLQAQVEPHFLFNTLANVRELVDSGSPQATTVLDSLIAYLRAAVPRLHEPATTMAQEIQLVRAYLELMHMRMPDRLQFTLQVDKEAEGLRCPPTTLLTLVENAVRHGIDPSEEGGRIEVRVRVQDGRCVAEVRDTGVGLKTGSDGSGTGLASLRERLQLVFGADVKLRISSLVPQGVCAEVDFPALGSAA
jgi:signal transduction histidine kinase